ncbi:hypothetical protein KIW84_063328 [Lathyrus oleraceus]|uniref:Uncharacterized protein n=1 Tax=Pisum sativum TaxID=3888 RepID=A0A9D5A6N5_PEA|nr:hypothetical protein KIW84_063328 [Pisum sativum]
MVFVVTGLHASFWVVEDFYIDEESGLLSVVGGTRPPTHCDKELFHGDDMYVKELQLTTTVQRSVVAGRIRCGVAINVGGFVDIVVVQMCSSSLELMNSCGAHLVAADMCRWLLG